MHLRRRRTWLERTLGVRHARRLRRRLAYLAFGTGLVALRPAFARTARVAAAGAGLLLVVGMWSCR
jgi:hypothetical protein